MLVVTANWAIGDGSVHGAPPHAAVGAFLHAVRRSAWRAGFRRDGCYRPIEAIHLVFAGDTLDGLVSLAWQGDPRPWHGTPRSRAVAERVAEAALRRGGRALAAIARLARRGIDVPVADGRLRPVLGSTRAVPVTVCCLSGDRDRDLESGFLAGLARRAGIHMGGEWSNGTTLVRHGDECDPLGIREPASSRGRFDRGPTLAESLAVDLVATFARLILDDAEHASRPGVGRWLRQLATAAPLDAPLHVMAWSREVPHGSLRKAWHAAVRHWHERARADRPEIGAPYDVVDPLAAWLDAAVSSAGDHAGPQPCAAIDAVVAARGAVPRPEAAMLVLGHPPAGEGPVAGHDARCICLGPRPRSRYAAGAGSSLVTAVFPDGGITDAVWFPGHMPVPTSRPTVARNGAASDDPWIVDAA